MVEEGVLGAATIANVGRLVGAFWDCSRMFVDSEIASDTMKEND